MGTKIPEQVMETELSDKLKTGGLKRIKQGKVRDIYSIPGFPNLLLFVTTDRLSIFDFVLNCLVPSKGYVLNALTIFWVRQLGISHHIVGYGRNVDNCLPVHLGDNSDFQKRAVIVENQRVLPIEFVVRGYLTGSGFKEYESRGTVCGRILPTGLWDGVAIPGGPIFTPTTKAEGGHDVPIDGDEVKRQYGRDVVNSALKTYSIAVDYAISRGIVIADTKFELSKNGFVDEILTPDSSRFWDREEWEKAQAKKQAPGGYDKQPVRNWGKSAQDLSLIHI